jgi:hypothetical protein
MMILLMVVFSVLLTFALFSILSETITCMTDTLLVCFIEAPERLRTSAKEFHDRLAKFYGKELQKRLILIQEAQAS